MFYLLTQVTTIIIRFFFVWTKHYSFLSLCLFLHLCRQDSFNVILKINKQIKTTPPTSYALKTLLTIFPNEKKKKFCLLTIFHNRLREDGVVLITTFQFCSWFVCPFTLVFYSFDSNTVPDTASFTNFTCLPLSSIT